MIRDSPHSGLDKVAEATLLARARTLGDEQAFGEIVKRYQGPVRGFLRRMCADVTMADDLAQDCFIKAWNKLSNFRNSGKGFGSWILRIAYREFLQQRRRDTRYRAALVRFADDSKSSVTQDQASLDLPVLLGALSEDERAVFVLAHGLGFTHSEIVSATGMALGTVKSHLRRGKLRIRDAFEINEVQDG